MLTNKPIASTRRILDGLDLARHFPPDAVLGGDGPFPRKPDPAALLHLAARAGAEADATLLVGDSVDRLADGARRRRRGCVWRDTGSDSTVFRSMNWHPKSS